MSTAPAPSEQRSHTSLPGPITLLGLPIVPWTLQQTAAEITRRIDERRFTQHGAVNAAKAANAHRDQSLREALLGCDILNADGMGLVLAARILGTPLPERVTGIDLFLHMTAIAAARGDGVFLLGAEPEVLDRAVSALRESDPRLVIAGWHHGYFWDDEEAVVRRIRESGATMLFVGITSPRKERFMRRWRDRLGVRFAMGVGGSFDVLAGKTRRSPRWMQRAGLEWLYRLMLEPRRLWRRYLIAHTRFALLLFQEWWNRPRQPS